MIPLIMQLQSRRRLLKWIRSCLALYVGRDFSHRALEYLGIDAYHLDIDSGTTSSELTSYFHLNISFPRCEDMDPGNSERSILANFNTTRPGSGSAFSNHLLWAFTHYGFEGDEELKSRVIDSDAIVYRGWRLDRSLNNENDRFSRLPSFWFERKRRFLNDSLSHAITIAEVSRCNKNQPDMSEIAVLLEEIQDGMKEQKKKLKSMAKSERLTRFHHILPRLVQIFDYRGHCRLLYGYFDGRRLKIQYTEVLDFSSVAIINLTDKRFIDVVDPTRYHEMMDKFLRWAWPIVEGDTGKHMLVD